MSTVEIVKFRTRVLIIRTSISYISSNEEGIFERICNNLVTV